MKTIILIFSMLISLSGCSDDDNTDCNGVNAYYSDDNTNTQDTSLIGTWKLISSVVYNGLSGGAIDYCDDNITYTFEQNGLLKVGDKQNVGYHKPGKYQYEFGEFTLGFGDPRKTLLIKINGKKWTYSLNNGIMRLGRSYVDGADLYFKRR